MFIYLFIFYIITSVQWCYSLPVPDDCKFYEYKTDSFVDGIKLDQEGLRWKKYICMSYVCVIQVNATTFRRNLGNSSSLHQKYPSIVLLNGNMFSIRNYTYMYL